MKLFGIGRTATVETEHENLADAVGVVQSGLDKAEHHCNVLRESIDGKTDEINSVGDVRGIDDCSLARRKRVNGARAELQHLQEEKLAVEKLIGSKRAEAEQLWERINATPLYASAISRHSEICERFVKLAEQSWVVGITKIEGLEKQISGIETEESAFLSVVNSGPSLAGLPALRPRIRHVGATVLPQVPKMDFFRQQAEAKEILQRISRF